jgi:chemotaxis protein MotA
MSLSTLIGLLSGISIVLTAMFMHSSATLFFNIPSLMIVFGGTLAVTMIRHSMKEGLNAVGTAYDVVRSDHEIKDLNELVDLTENLLRTMRQKGALALENYEINHAFYRYGIRMLVDGYSRELLMQTLKEQNRLFVAQAQSSAAVFRAVGEAAPAFGMMGTLVGLIQMLANLSDPSSIGPAMAVAMLTTLYGVMIAHLFALPLADKIEAWAQAESYRQVMIIEAIDCLIEGHNPAVMRDLLAPFLHGNIKVVHHV